VDKGRLLNILCNSPCNLHSPYLTDIRGSSFVLTLSDSEWNELIPAVAIRGSIREAIIDGLKQQQQPQQFPYQLGQSFLHLTSPESLSAYHNDIIALAGNNNHVVVVWDEADVTALAEKFRDDISSSLNKMCNHERIQILMTTATMAQTTETALRRMCSFLFDVRLSGPQGLADVDPTTTKVPIDESTQHYCFEMVALSSSLAPCTHRSMNWRSESQNRKRAMRHPKRDPRRRSLNYRLHRSNNTQQRCDQIAFPPVRDWVGRERCARKARPAPKGSHYRQLGEGGY
jgi:hypothetical protein